MTIRKLTTIHKISNTNLKICVYGRIRDKIKHQNAIGKFFNYTTTKLQVIMTSDGPLNTL